MPEPLLVHLRRARDLADTDYARPLDLDALAGAAGVSTYHFLRCFTATYGVTPATNLTVTEVCMLVGYSSLGSFSTRFRRLVGVSPSAYQSRHAGADVPRIPGCYVFMHRLSDRVVDADRAPRPVPAASTATSEKPDGTRRP